MSKMHVNGDFINDLLTKVMQAAESGTSIDFSDGDEVGQYVLSILALGAELIPVIGGALGAFTSLLGAIFFSSSPLSMEKIWEGLRERIEKLIDSKIEQYHLEVLAQKIRGIQENMAVYRQYVRDFQHATGPDKEQAARTLHVAHVAFSNVVLAALPEFQLDRFAVASLPLFALVANIYLALLVDGIKEGRQWGYSPQNIQTMEAQFQAKTRPRGRKLPHDHFSRQKCALEEAIKAGPELGIPDNIIETWKEAYVELYESGKKTPRDSNSDLDYVSYAKTIYSRGRAEVKPYKDVPDRGGPEAGEYRAYADYDTSMVMNVLNYAELWPFMSGGTPITEAALRAVDREIFYGPFGRYTSHAAWGPSTPPRITDRGAPITAVVVRAWDDVDGLQIKQGASWGAWQGSSTGGAPRQLDLAPDEWITSFEVMYGHKLGKVKFGTNKGRALENGNARHAHIQKSGAPPGYQLTSVIVTNYELHIPPGCEGVILGYRPLMTDSSRE